MKIISQQLTNNLQALENLKIPNHFSYHLEDNREKEYFITKHKILLDFLNDSDQCSLKVNKFKSIVQETQLETNKLLAKYLKSI